MTAPNERRTFNGGPSSQLAEPLAATNAITTHFQELSATWIQRYATHASFKARLAIVSDAIDAVLRAQPSAFVLDFGGGAGVFSAMASDLAGKILCLDPSIGMIIAGAQNQGLLASLTSSSGRTYRPERISRLVGTLDAIGPSALGAFDLVMAVSVLEYLPDVDKQIKKLLSLTAPGGTLLFTVPNPSSIVRRIERPADSIAAAAGRVLQSPRLAARSYSSLRLNGSEVPWRDALPTDGFQTITQVGLPLAATGIRSRLYPSTLIMAKVREQ